MENSSQKIDTKTEIVGKKNLKHEINVKNFQLKNVEKIEIDEKILKRKVAVKNSAVRCMEKIEIICEKI